MGYLDLKILSSVTAGLSLLTVSVKLFSLPLTCEISISTPRCFCSIASNFIKLLVNLLELENYWYQLLADLLLPVQCSIDYHLYTICLLFMAVSAAKKLSTIAGSLSPLIYNISICLFGRWMRQSISGSRSSQLSCYQILKQTCKNHNKNNTRILRNRLPNYLFYGTMLVFYWKAKIYCLKFTC